MKSRQKLLILAVSVVLLLGLVAGGFGCAAKTEEGMRLNMGAGSIGSSNYIQKTAVKILVEKYTPHKITIIPYASITFAVKGFEAGDADIAGIYAYQFSKPDLKADWHPRSRYLWGWWAGNLAVVALDQSDIKTFEDLRGKRIGSGPKGGMGDRTLVYLMDKMGWVAGKDYKVVNHAFIDYGKILREGTADAFMATWSYTGAYVHDLVSTDKFREITLPEPQTGDMLKEAWGEGTFMKTMMNKGDWATVDKGYAGEFPFEAYWLSCWWGVWEDLDEDVVYDIVKAVWDHEDEGLEMWAGFKYIKRPEFFNLADQQRPFHDGALKYYKEQGWITESHRYS
ncbi:TAXI family TRAP transporter solute-binding subunit [Chloroflexota bacterium]